MTGHRPRSEDQSRPGTIPRRDLRFTSNVVERARGLPQPCRPSLPHDLAAEIQGPVDQRRWRSWLVQRFAIPFPGEYSTVSPLSGQAFVAVVEDEHDPASDETGGLYHPQFALSCNVVASFTEKNSATASIAYQISFVYQTPGLITVRRYDRLTLGSVGERLSRRRPPEIIIRE